MIKKLDQKRKLYLEKNEDNFFVFNFEMSPLCLKLSLFYPRGKPLEQKSENFKHSGNISKVHEKKLFFFQEIVFLSKFHPIFIEKVLFCYRTAFPGFEN